MNGRTKVAPALECEDGCHETTSGPRSSELGGDSGAQWVAAANAQVHEEAPADKSADDTDNGTFPADGLTECADDDNYELDTI
jgi:hypothetical protein